jgi:hypothetical protein
MTKDNSSNAGAKTDRQADAVSPALANRKDIAYRVPFFLRAWFLKDFPEYKDFSWLKDDQPVALWSNYSDPICDLGDIDVFDES